MPQLLANDPLRVELGAPDGLLLGQGAVTQRADVAVGQRLGDRGDPLFQVTRGFAASAGGDDQPGEPQDEHPQAPAEDVRPHEVRLDQRVPDGGGLQRPERRAAKHGKQRGRLLGQEAPGASPVRGDITVLRGRLVRLAGQGGQPAASQLRGRRQYLGHRAGSVRGRGIARQGRLRCERDGSTTMLLRLVQGRLVHGALLFGTGGTSVRAI